MNVAERELQLRAMAAASERRNRPRALTALGVAALVIGAGVLIYGVSAAAEARVTAEREARQLAEAQALVEQIRAIRLEAAGSVDRSKYRPEGGLLTTLARVQDQVQLENRPTLRSGRNRPLSPDSPFTARTVTATFVEPDIEQAMQWINGALRASPGLFVTGIELRPTPSGWSVQVDLARWEISQ